MPKIFSGPLRIANALPTNTSFTSDPIPATGIDTGTFIIETAGVTAASGSFKVLAKNGQSGWVDLGLTPTVQLNNANLSTAILLTDLCFTQIRFQFDRGAPGDVGTYSVWFQGEGMN